MKIFENLMDVNEAAIRYQMTPQGIKQQIGKKLEEDVDCKKFGNSWVFVRPNLDVIFREKLKENERKPILEKEKEMLVNMGKVFVKKYMERFGKEQTKEMVEELSEKMKEKNEVLYAFLRFTLDAETSIQGNLTYCMDDTFYPESGWLLMSGILQGMNEN